DRCLNSVFNQTYQNLEIILVNDGSTDNSLKICKKWEEKDPRIKIIDKENEGLSAARNDGIINSTGEYIAFLDSDDFITEDAYEKLLEPILKDRVDISVGNIINYFGDNSKVPKVKKKYIYGKIQTSSNFLVKNIRNHSYTVVSVQGIYSRNLIVDNNIFF